MGMTKMLSRVEVMSPPRTTTAMGAWISLPGWSAARIMGTSDKAVVRAVMMMGLNRSIEP